LSFLRQGSQLIVVGRGAGRQGDSAREGAMATHETLSKAPIRVCGKISPLCSRSKANSILPKRFRGVAAIRRMIAQSNTWKQIQGLDSKSGPSAKTKSANRTADRISQSR
jgi:hypothetical protein